MGNTHVTDINSDISALAIGEICNQSGTPVGECLPEATIKNLISEINQIKYMLVNNLITMFFMYSTF